MAENLKLKNTLQVDGNTYDINAVYSDEAGKVTNFLTVKESGSKVFDFDGSGSGQTIDYVSAEKGGRFAKPIYIDNSKLTEPAPFDAVITSGEVNNRIVELNGEPLCVWNANNDYRLQSLVNTDDVLYKMTTVVGTSTDFESFKKYALGGSTGLSYKSTNQYGKLRLTGIGDCTDTELLIPEYDESGAKITEIGSSAFRNNTDITSVIIPYGITSIGENAFNGCTNLTRVIIADSVTTIRAGAFNGCSSLTRVELGNGIKTIEYQAFANCTSLSDIIIPDSVTSLGWAAFSGCSHLEYIRLSDNLTDIESTTFRNCNVLRDIVLGNRIATIDSEAFYGCSELESIVIPASVTTIQAKAFDGCNSLNKVTYNGKSTDWSELALNDLTLAAVSAIEYLLEDYTFTLDSTTTTASYTISKYTGNATELSIPSIYNALPVTKIAEGAFQNCSSITAITVPNSITDIGAGAFNGCSSLVSITLPFVGSNARSTTASETTLFGYIFGTTQYTGGTKTKQVYAGVSSSYKEYYIPTSLKTVVLTGGILLYGAFYNCANITEITIPLSVTNISSQVFYGCSSLTKLYYDGSWADWNRVVEATGTTSTGITNYDLLEIVPIGTTSSTIQLKSAIRGPFIYICRDVEEEFNPSNKIYLKLPGESDIIEISKGATRLNGPENDEGTQPCYTYEGLAEIIARINLRLDALGGEDLALKAVLAPLPTIEEVNNLVPDKEIAADIDPESVPTVWQLEKAIASIQGKDKTTINDILTGVTERDNLKALREDLDALADEVTYELERNPDSPIFAATSRLDILEDRLKRLTPTRFEKLINFLDTIELE